MLALLLACFLGLLPIPPAFQAVAPTQTPKPDADGVYQVPASELRPHESSPRVEFPRELIAYEVTDKVVIEVTISPEGAVERVKAISGGLEVLKRAAENAAKKWTFYPYLVNGTPVRARAELTFSFDNTFDGYRDPDGDVPVRLDEKASHAGEKDPHSHIIKTVPPDYPRTARTARIQGAVELRVIVGKDGSVQRIHIISGHPMLIGPAYDAVRQWKFEPYRVDGKAVPVETKVTVNFTLSG